jgi:formamidopyrimidine-DNA glycosylase
VPELPDLDVVADAFHAALAGRSIDHVRALMPLTVRGTPAELGALAGQRVERLARVGKFLDVVLERDRVIVNPMLTGRFQLAGRGEKAPSGSALELVLGQRAGGPPDAAAWTSGAGWMPGDDAPLVVRYRDPTQMGKVYLLPAGIDRPVPGRSPGEMGPDALDPALTLEVWRDRIRRHPGSSRTCCATRRSSRASATPTPTRSCGRRGCSRSGSARRSPRRRWTGCIARCDRR